MPGGGQNGSERGRRTDVLGELELAWMDLLEQVPVGLQVVYSVFSVQRTRPAPASGPSEDIPSTVHIPGHARRPSRQTFIESRTGQSIEANLSCAISQGRRTHLRLTVSRSAKRQHCGEARLALVLWSRRRAGRTEGANLNEILGVVGVEAGGHVGREPSRNQESERKRKREGMLVWNVMQEGGEDVLARNGRGWWTGLSVRFGGQPPREPCKDAQNHDLSPVR